jgi:hypothetical protein
MSKEPPLLPASMRQTPRKDWQVVRTLMTLPSRPALVALLVCLALIARCSIGHGDPKNPKKNPHPLKRYEIIATTEAPGPWDSIKGVAFFNITNVKCIAEKTFPGVRDVPESVEQSFEMTKVDEKTWKGYFYRDSFKDENYFGLGDCHWDVTSATPFFTVNSNTFGTGSTLVTLLHGGPETDYFMKSDFKDREKMLYGPSSFTAKSAEVIKHPDNFFPITIAIKEATP